ncbi:hypothetical protein BDR03DRAFT_389074 [Suillus americanus]|nr:hypothetical protein BDR03DRAFT_389074 [Suillus americanus]
MATEFTPGSAPGQEDTPLPGRPSDTNNRTSGIVIQHNYMAEGVTLNISSSNSYGSISRKQARACCRPTGRARALTTSVNEAAGSS